VLSVPEETVLLTGSVLLTGAVTPGELQPYANSSRAASRAAPRR